jgi:hypothetical protein
MKFTRSPLLASLLIVSACTTVDHESGEYSERTRHHQIIAVLPFEMVLAGDPPHDLTAEEIAQIEEAESTAFQEAYYHHLLHQASVGRKHPIWIEIQPVETTDRLLAEAGIGIRESWTMSAKSLARVLRVDAVVRTKVQKTRYLSGGESFGVDLGFQVISQLSEGWLASWLPWELTKTNEIFASCELIDSLDGWVIWRTEFEAATDWRAPANQVIAGFTEELAKTFPYRE